MLGGCGLLECFRLLECCGFVEFWEGGIVGQVERLAIDKG